MSVIGCTFTSFDRRELVPVKTAFIYKLPSRFVVCPVSTTTSGIGLTSEPYIVLLAPVSAVDLSNAINQALDSSHDGVAHPVSWKGLAAPRLASAGVKSEAAFQKQASLVSVVTDGRTATFTPHRNGGANGLDKGFVPIDECAEQVDPTANEVCGETALQVFKRCT
jgi:hypothetical protein